MLSQIVSLGSTVPGRLRDTDVQHLWLPLSHRRNANITVWSLHSDK